VDILTWAALVFGAAAAAEVAMVVAMLVEHRVLPVMVALVAPEAVGPQERPLVGAVVVQQLAEVLGQALLDK